MNESNVSGHWTDEQLIEYLYGVGEENGHVDACADCQGRLASMRAKRQTADLSPSLDGELSFEFLAAQRRKIYARLTAPRHWWDALQPGRLVSAAATLVVLGGGLFLYEENHKQRMMENTVSDAQLAQEVSTMSQEAEAQPTAPLQALFDE